MRDYNHLLSSRCYENLCCHFVAKFQRFNHNAFWVLLRFCSVMEGEESLPLFSPELLVLSPSFREAVPLLPPISLFHGTADYSILYDARYVHHEHCRNFLTL